MTLRRLLLVSLTTFGLLSLPAVASAASAESDTMPAAKVAAKGVAKAGTPTRISFMQFDHSRVYGSDTVIRGQVLISGGSVRATGIKLQRRYQGSTRWATIGTTDTTVPAYPRFTFTVRTNANAFYRVNYAGESGLLLPSSADTKVVAFRKVTTYVKSRQLVAYGKVTPSYTGKRMTVQRKTCATCTYKAVRTIKVKAGSKYKTTLTAPANGRWWWRLVTRADKKFVASSSATIVTRRIG